MKKITVPARLDELDHVLDFVNGELEANNCVIKEMLQIAIAVEEIFVNISKYAYLPEKGEAEIECSFYKEPKSVSICFKDKGVPYNPLEKPDPDISLSSEERKIGGLGIYMVKKSMDEVLYEYKEDRNILTIIKKLT